MTNEEIVLLIQKGQRERTAELWSQVKRFVCKQAYRYHLGSRGRGGTELEDLTQVGFLAVYAAADTFQPDSGAHYLTWLNYYLQTAFAEATGTRTDRQYKEPLNHAASLSAPLGDDIEGDTLGDILPAPDIWEYINGSIWQQEARAVVFMCLDSLPDPQGEIVYRRYYADQTREHIASEMGLPDYRVRGEEEKALNALRQGWRRRALQELLGEPVPSIYTGTGIQAFRNTGISSVELAFMKRESSA